MVDDGRKCDDGKLRDTRDAGAADGVECCTLVSGEHGVTEGLPQYPELLVFSEVCAI